LLKTLVISEKICSQAVIAVGSSDRLTVKKKTAQSDHLHKKNIASPSERSGNADAFPKLEVKDLRFSMKMTFAPYPGIWLQPV